MAGSSGCPRPTPLLRRGDAAPVAMPGGGGAAWGRNGWRHAICWLFAAFVRPAWFCLPSCAGLCEVPRSPLPTTPEEEARVAARHFAPPDRRVGGHGGAWLVREKATAFRHGARATRSGQATLAAPASMRRHCSRARWLASTLEEPAAGGTAAAAAAQKPAPSSCAVAPWQLIAAGVHLAEARPQLQGDYASAASQAFAARARGTAQCRAGRSRHRRRQNSGLRRAGFAVGREERRTGVDRHLHPQLAAPDRHRFDRLHRDSAEKRRRVVVRKAARIISAC